MQTESIGSCLQKLRQTYNEYSKVTKYLLRIKELEQEDGLRAYRNITGVSSKGSGRGSTIERILVDRETKRYDVDKYQEEADRRWVQMQNTLEEIRYRIRGKEFNLLQAVYIEQLTPTKLEIIYGRQWARTLNGIFKQYGG